MRRVLSALAVAGLSVVLVLGGVLAPASAEDPIPWGGGPVDEIIGLPSQVKKSVTGSPLGDLAARDMMWALRAQANMAGTGTVAPIPKPVTPPVPVVRPAPSGGAVGGTLGLAFTAGWAITDGTLALYGATTGQEPLGSLCGAYDDWFVAAVQMAYMFSAPDCAAPIAGVNNDVVAGVQTLTYSGVNVRVTGKLFEFPAGVTYECVGRANVTPPANTTLQVKLVSAGTANGGWSQLGWFAHSTTGGCGTGQPAGIYNGVTGGIRGFRVQSSTTGETLAESGMAVADPDRNIDCRLQWPDGTTTTGTGPTYKESAGLSPAGISNSCNDAFVSKPGAGPDLLPTEIEVGSTRQDTGGRTIVTEQPVPEYSPDERQGLKVGNGRGLVLEKVVNGVARNCLTWEADCTGWWTATQQGTQPDTGVGVYRCTYAGNSVALTECGAYQQTFNNRTQTPTVTDPVTGEQIPWSSGAPGWSVTNPAVTGGGGCGAPFTLNPVDWVVNPLKCLFIPGQAAIAQFQGRIDDGIGDSLIGPIRDGLAELALAFDSGIGCGGLPIHLEAFGTTIVHSYILESCSEPAAGVAATVKTVLTVGIWGGALLALTRYLGALFAFTAYGGEPRSRSSGVSFD